jgi:hypothetical protein
MNYIPSSGDSIASPWVVGLVGAALICAAVSTTKASSTKNAVDRKEDHLSSKLVGNRSKSLKEELTAERKAASAVTQKANASVYTQLPFEDRKDFELVTRGLVGKEENLVIKDENGTIVWDMDAFISMLRNKDDNNEEQQPPDTVNPSLWRQSQLLAHHGLYKVTDRIYQGMFKWHTSILPPWKLYLMSFNLHYDSHLIILFVIASHYILT